MVTHTHTHTHGQTTIPSTHAGEGNYPTINFTGMCTHLPIKKSVVEPVSKVETVDVEDNNIVKPLYS